MNDSNHDLAFGEQCRVCGDRIGEAEGRQIAEDGEIAYVHTNCA